MIDVELTAACIRDGRIGDSTGCPLVLALYDAVKVGVTSRASENERHPFRHGNPRVTGGLIHWTYQGRQLAVTVPERVGNWLRRYDAGERVSPMAFTLRVHSLADTN